MNFRQSLRTLALLGLGSVIGAGLVMAWGVRREAGAVLAGEPGRSVSLSQGQDAGAGASRGWVKGKGWGWIWGKDDEVGSLNALSNQTRAAALSLAKTGQVFDLGLTYSRRSYKWPGHSPGEILTFRSPDGVHRMKDADAPPVREQPGPGVLAFRGDVHLR